VNPNKGKFSSLRFIILAVLLCGYAIYGFVFTDLFYANRWGITHFHGIAARFVACFYFCLCALWFLTALLGDDYDRTEHPVLDIIGRCLLIGGIVLFYIGVFIHVLTPKEKPVYHPGDRIVIPKSSDL
jgi:hypothetical protein